MITFVNNNDKFASTIQLIDAYIEEHADSELFEFVTIVADIKNKTLTATYAYADDGSNKLILRENDLEKPLIVALTLIGYATIMENIGDIKPDHFKCLYSGEC